MFNSYDCVTYISVNSLMIFNQFNIDHRLYIELNVKTKSDIRHLYFSEFSYAIKLGDYR